MFSLSKFLFYDPSKSPRFVLLAIRNIIPRRLFSVDGASSRIRVERLKGRSILSVEGSESQDFLQGLITNDIKRLEEDKCLFTAFLNSNGKVIHDAIIYKPEEKCQYLVECDASSLEALQIHMSMNRKSSRVAVRSIENKLNIWVAYNHEEDPIEEFDLGDNILVCFDPRIADLGLRILAPAGVNVSQKVQSLGRNVLNSHVSLYRWLRYKLGVGEGSSEIPYGRYSPSEANCDFLNGMSTKKSYFFGQEQAEKNKSRSSNEQRIMPICFEKNKDNYFPLNTPIEDMKRKRKTPIGYLRGSQGSFGIGLMKVARALEEDSVRIRSTFAHCLRPPWWPSAN